MVFVGLTWGCGVVPAAVPAGVDQATARVRFRVEPQIIVSQPRVVAVDLQDYRAASSIRSQVRFSVHANTHQVELHVACTDLCMAGDPASEHKIPVAGAGAGITPERAGGAQLLPWLGSPPPGVLPAGWTGAVSEAGVFVGPSAGTFNGDVTVDISWQSADLDLPTGQYCGIVTLIGMINP